jgi:hypothetical protein
VQKTNIGMSNIKNATHVMMQLMDSVLHAQLVAMMKQTRFIVALHAPVLPIKHPLLLQQLRTNLQLQHNVLQSATW